MLFFHKKNPPIQPVGLSWCWTLTVDGMPTAEFDWPALLRGLNQLRPDRDSFVALERMDPNDPREAGFLQCTVILQGDHGGWYLLECGYPGPEGPVLLEREVSSLEEVCSAFQTVYRQKGTDFPGFSDLSDAIGQN